MIMLLVFLHMFHFDKCFTLAIAIRLKEGPLLFCHLRLWWSRTYFEATVHRVLPNNIVVIANIILLMKRKPSVILYCVNIVGVTIWT